MKTKRRNFKVTIKIGPGMQTRADIAATLEAIARILTKDSLTACGNTRAAMAHLKYGSRGSAGTITHTPEAPEGFSNDHAPIVIGQWDGAPEYES